MEPRLQQRLDIPVFHDDQHGTAVVVLAALLNGAKVVGRALESLRVVVSGAGAAGIAVAAILRRAGVADVLVCDGRGVVGPHRDDLPDHKAEARGHDQPPRAERHVGARPGRRGRLRRRLRRLRRLRRHGGTVAEHDVATMADGAIILALANPTPEVHPEVASRQAVVVGTGRSDFPNQINNVLAFPGIVRGALDARAVRVTEGMNLAAAHAIAAVVAEPTPGEVVPCVFDDRVVTAVAAAVGEAARRDGVCRP